MDDIAYNVLLAEIVNQIVANANNEITAEVLEPILENLLNFSHDRTGNPANLATTDRANLVAAINELKSLIDENNEGVQVYSGLDNPNDTPPPSYQIGDMYSQLLPDNSAIDLFIFTGLKWVSIQNPDPSGEIPNLQQVVDKGNTIADSSLVLQDSPMGCFSEPGSTTYDYDGIVARSRVGIMDVRWPATDFIGNTKYQWPIKNTNPDMETQYLDTIAMVSDLPNTNNFIPIKGTTEGNPVTGDISFDLDGIQNIKKYFDPNSGVYIQFPDEASLLIGSENTDSPKGGLRFSLGGVFYESENPEARGISGSADYTENITDLDYTQKKYVDNQIVSVGEAYTDLSTSNAIKNSYLIRKAKLNSNLLTLIQEDGDSHTEGGTSIGNYRAILNPKWFSEFKKREIGYIHYDLGSHVDKGASFFKSSGLSDMGGSTTDYSADPIKYSVSGQGLYANAAVNESISTDVTSTGKVFTKVRIYYLQRPDGGSFTYKFNSTSGSGTAVSMVGTLSIQYVELIKTAADNNIVAINNITGKVAFFGIRFYNGTVAGSDLCTAIGGMSINRLSLLDPTFRQTWFSIFTPSLTILDIGTNDRGVLSAADFKTKLINHVSTLLAGSPTTNVVLVEPVQPIDYSSTNAPAFRIARQEVATQLGLQLIDLPAIFGDYTSMVAQGYMFDGVHENPKFQEIKARVYAEFLSLNNYGGFRTDVPDEVSFANITGLPGDNTLLATSLADKASVSLSNSFASAQNFNAQINSQSIVPIANRTYSSGTTSAQWSQVLSGVIKSPVWRTTATAEQLEIRSFDGTQNFMAMLPNGHFDFGGLVVPAVDSGFWYNFRNTANFTSTVAIGGQLTVSGKATVAIAPTSSTEVVRKLELDVMLTGVTITANVATTPTNIKYIANASTRLTIPLPSNSTSAIGNFIEIRGLGTGGWKLSQPEATTVIHGATDTTIGTAGYIQSQARYDTIRVEKIAANEWVVVAVTGVPTIV